MTNYVNLDIKDMNETEREIVNAVIHEGEMRQNEKIIALLERKVTEAYGSNSRELIDFLEELIVEIENI
jgi:hypothetical protein